MNNLELGRKREVVRNYIRDNPGCTYREIRKATKIKVERVYKNMVGAYKDSGVKLSKNLTKRNLQSQKKDVIQFIRQNPGCSVVDIHEKVKVNVVRVFGSIMEAYNLAGIEYPEREITSGVMNPEVIKRSNQFEKHIFGLLERFGSVKPKVRTSKGIVDCLFTYKQKNYVVEIKDFRGNNNITFSQIKQLMNYMEDLDIKRGLLVCPKESFPKRRNSRNLYKDGQIIKILSAEDLWGRSINLLD